jgi:hypothetical protein
MTGYTVHTGSTEQFSEGWDRIFSGKKKGAAKPAAAKPVAKAKAKKKAKKK